MLVLSRTSSAFHKLLPFSILPDYEKGQTKKWHSIHAAMAGEPKRKCMKIKPSVFFPNLTYDGLGILRAKYVFLFSWVLKVNKH